MVAAVAVVAAAAREAEEGASSKAAAVAKPAAASELGEAIDKVLPLAETPVDKEPSVVTPVAKALREVLFEGAPIPLEIED